jgi:hypothetical protein
MDVDHNNIDVIHSTAGNLRPSSDYDLVAALRPDVYKAKEIDQVESLSGSFSQAIKRQHLGSKSLEDVSILLRNVALYSMSPSDIERLADKFSALYEQTIKDRDRWLQVGVPDAASMKKMVFFAVQSATVLLAQNGHPVSTAEYQGMLDRTLHEQDVSGLLHIRNLLAPHSIGESSNASKTNELMGYLEFLAAAKDSEEGIVLLLEHLGLYHPHEGDNVATIKSAINFWEGKLKRIQSNGLSKIPLKSIGDSSSEQAIDLLKRFGNLLKPMTASIVDMDVDEVWQTLHEEYPWMDDVNEEICIAIDECAGSAFKIKNLIIAGPPGIAKTFYANRIAEILSLKSSMRQISGSNYAMLINGSERGWSSSHPSLPAHVMSCAGRRNPLIIVDEIDKAASHDVIYAFLPFLESHTAAKYEDNCLLGPLDASDVNWIFTANDISNLPAPFLSRCKVIKPRYPNIRDLNSVIMFFEKKVERRLSDVESSYISKSLQNGLSLRDIVVSPKESSWKRPGQTKMALVTG